MPDVPGHPLTYDVRMGQHPGVHAETLADTPAPTADTIAAPGSSSSAGAPRKVAIHATVLDDTTAARYQSQRALGHGGMGEVRLADDLRIGRQVAVKTLREDTRGDAAAAARFLREARVQGQLEHPAIVPVYDLGTDTDGVPFFTMKRLRGMTLEELLRAHHGGDAETAKMWSQRKLLGAFAQACQAVHFAHSRGVVHRDLKPSNIMLGDFGEIYVLDWGVARIAGVADDGVPAISTGESESERTAHGSVIGTPGYMAPEQLRGEVDIVGPASDVYALGTILFELLTGQPLHARTSRDSIIQSTLHGVDTSERLRSRQPDLAPELEAICVRATALAPEARYGDVAALVTDLEKFLDGDRDLERRRQLANEHAATALAAAEQSQQGIDEEANRKRALREAGRALALDPANTEAATVMTRLFIDPPARIPDEVEAELQRADATASHREAIVGAMVYIAVLCFAPLYIAMGVTDWRYMAATATLALGMGVQAYRHGIAGTLTFTTVQVALVGYVALVVLLSRTLGPFVLVPATGALGTAFFVLHGRNQHTVLTIVAGCVAVTLPLVLELAGVFGRTFEIRDDMLILRSDIVHLPPTLTLVLLTTVSVATVIAGGVFVRDARRNQEAAERKLQLQSWQLRQLVPAQTHVGVGTTSPVTM